MEVQFTQYGNWFVVGITLAAIWSLIWKGVALWKAARRSSKAWFVVLLILNTLGILEIIYIFLVSKNKEEA